MKILLTGANGQLGRALQELCSKTGDEVHAFSRDQLDITNQPQIEKVIAKVHPDVLINAAAYNHVEQAEVESAPAFSGNEDGPKKLALATAAKKITLVHVSTDYVFDGKLSRAYLESDKTNPLNEYAKSKLAGEKAVLKSNPQSYVVRTAWVFHKGGRNFLTGILANKEKPFLQIVDDQFGSPTYAPHLAEKILHMVKAKAPYGIYHMSGHGKVSRYNLAKFFFREMGIKTELKPIPAKDFPSRVHRPAATPLDTEHGEKFRLPKWELGVKQFVKDIQDEK